MRRLVMIRHSETEPVQGVESREWRLSPEGRARCRVLGERLVPYDVRAVATSPEPKAIETASAIAAGLAVPLTAMDGLAEHDRRGSTQLLARDAWRELIRRLFERPGELVHGRETADQAHARFSAAVASAVEQHPAGGLALVTHATVMALFIARRPQLDPFPLWASLGMPAYAVFSLPGLELVELVPALV